MWGGNFCNLSRYFNYPERTIPRQFRVSFDWPDFHQRAINSALDPRSELITLPRDASFISKSGLRTFGLGHFFNGFALRNDRGLKTLILAVYIFA